MPIDEAETMNIKKLLFYCSLAILIIFTSLIASRKEASASEIADNYTIYYQPLYFISKSTILNAARIVGSESEHGLMTNGDNIYISKPIKTESIDRYSIIRVQKQLSADSIYLATKIADADLVNNVQNIAIIKIKNATQEVTGNDLVIPNLNKPDIKNQTKKIGFKSQAKIEAKVVYIPNDDFEMFVGQFQSVVINAGTNNKLKTGDGVYFYSLPKLVDGKYKIPGQQKGSGYVYRSSPEYSLVLITKGNSEIYPNDIVSTSSDFYT